MIMEIILNYLIFQTVIIVPSTTKAKSSRKNKLLAKYHRAPISFFQVSLHPLLFWKEGVHMSIPMFVTFQVIIRCGINTFWFS